MDPSTFRWTDASWRGLVREGQVLYEMHVGTFTPAGTWRSAADQLPHLAAPEPLLAAPSGAVWNVRWSSEAVCYGGQGAPPLDPAGEWRLPGECALLLTSEQGRAK